MPTVLISNNTGADFSGTEDVKIRSITPTSNYGTHVEINAHNNSVPSDVENFLIRFTGLSNITGPVVVSSCTLELYLTLNFLSAQNADLFRQLRTWTESGATWNTYDGTNNWATAGGTGSGDIAASASATTLINATVGYYAFSSAQLASDVQNIINGVASNNGWLGTPNGANLGAVFASSDGTDGQRPKLTFTYTASGGGTVLMGQACL